MRRGSALYQIMCMKEHQLYLGEDENPLLEPIAYELANCENLDFDKIELAVALLCISVFKQKDDEGVVDIEGMMSGLKNG